MSTKTTPPPRPAASDAATTTVLHAVKTVAARLDAPRSPPDRRGRAAGASDRSCGAGQRGRPAPLPRCPPPRRTLTRPARAPRSSHVTISHCSRSDR